MEIEKKYLLRKIPFDLSDYRREELAQAYLSFDPETRIRKIDNRYIKTTKGDGTLCRPELNENISEEMFYSLSSRIISEVIFKTRYTIPIGNGLNAELDIYYSHLAGLMTVEVEFETLEQAQIFVKPDWFGDDITEELDFKNKNLSMFKRDSERYTALRKKYSL